jgi:hypothetical protein
MPLPAPRSPAETVTEARKTSYRLLAE